MKPFGSGGWSFGDFPIVVDLRDTRGSLVLTATGSARMVMVSAIAFLGLPFFFTTSAADIVTITIGLCFLAGSRHRNVWKFGRDASEDWRTFRNTCPLFSRVGAVRGPLSLLQRCSHNVIYARINPWGSAYVNYSSLHLHCTYSRPSRGLRGQPTYSYFSMFITIYHSSYCYY